jgi:hypothetical protein
MRKVEGFLNPFWRPLRNIGLQHSPSHEASVARERLVQLELHLGATFLQLFDTMPLPEQKDLALRNAKISHRLARVVVRCLDAEKGEKLESQIESLAERIRTRQGHLEEDVNNSSCADTSSK